QQNKANSIIDTLQDAIDYKMATDNEKELLVEWKKYRVLLNRINPEDALNIDWPVEPASQ
ncbi:tail fiber assembly protein, partial [Salmonella enterica]|nr:tail fiber assembly protein [Salmonella enterica]